MARSVDLLLGFFVKAPSTLQNHIHFVTEGLGVKPMVASVVLKIRCQKSGVTWTSSDFIYAML